MPRQFHVDGTLPRAGAIFVFGSNLAGRHGKGAALVALDRFGAVYGQARGLQGRSYAIPTKDGRPGTPPLQDVASTRPLADIAQDVQVFIAFARSHPEMQFFISRLGCSLANHKNEDIAPLFKDAPDNCSFAEDWAPWLGGLPQGSLF
jgi:hypothetical protein